MRQEARNYSQEDSGRSLHERAFGNLYESLDQESQIGLEIELGTLLSNTPEKESLLKDVPPERRYESLLKLLSNKLEMEAGEIKEHLGHHQDPILEPENLTSFEELKSCRQIRDAAGLKSVLEQLQEEVQLTQAHILPNYHQARSPLAAERHYGLKTPDQVLPVMKFDPQTGELFIWSSEPDRNYLQQRCVLLEDENSDIKESLVVNYNPRSFFQEGYYANREPLMLNATLYSLVFYPQYCLDKRIQIRLDPEAGILLSVDFEMSLQLPTAAGLVERSYAASLDATYKEPLIKNQSFKLQRFQEKRKEPGFTPQTSHLGIILHGIKVLERERYPVPPLEEFNLERTNETLRLRVEKRHGCNPADLELSLDKEYFLSDTNQPPRIFHPTKWRSLTRS